LQTMAQGGGSNVMWPARLCWARCSEGKSNIKEPRRSGFCARPLAQDPFRKNTYCSCCFVCMKRFSET
jgi:hypothetical protein